MGKGRGGRYGEANGAIGVTTGSGGWGVIVHYLTGLNKNTRKDQNGKTRKIGSTRVGTHERWLACVCGVGRIGGGQINEAETSEKKVQPRENAQQNQKGASATLRQCSSRIKKTKKRQKSEVRERWSREKKEIRGHIEGKAMGRGGKRRTSRYVNASNGEGGGEKKGPLAVSILRRRRGNISSQGIQRKQAKKEARRGEALLASPCPP